MNADERALNHLYDSIDQLDCSKRIDAEIYKRVTLREPKLYQKDSEGRFGMLSAQTVRQDMNLLKVMRQSRRATQLMRSQRDYYRRRSTGHSSINQAPPQGSRRLTQLDKPSRIDPQE